MEPLTEVRHAYSIQSLTRDDNWVNKKSKKNEENTADMSDEQKR